MAYEIFDKEKLRKNQFPKYIRYILHTKYCNSGGTIFWLIEENYKYFFVKWKKE